MIPEISQAEAFGLSVISMRHNRHRVIRLAGPRGQANWVLSKSPSDRQTDVVNAATLKRLAGRLGATQ